VTKKIFAIIALLSVTEPAVAQTMLDKFIGKLTKRGSGQPALQEGGSNLAGMTTAQGAEIDRLLAQPMQNANLTADRQVAMPVIRTMVATAACASAGEAWNTRNRLMMRPQTFRGYVPAITPMLRTQYHDKSKCMDVVRIGDWSKPAANALKFRAYFVAGDSGEAANVTFELQRSSEGEWLVRDFGGLPI
jgi:hypothetical protein